MSGMTPFIFYERIPMNSLTKAMSVDLYKANGEKIPSFKALVNATKPDQIFNVVSDSYKLAQHDTIVDSVNLALKNLGITHTTKASESQDGGRLLLDVRCENIKLEVGSRDWITLQIQIQNSYTGVVGVLLSSGFFRCICQNRAIILEKLSGYYHKHTKGLELSAIEANIAAAVTAFQTRMRMDIEKMVATPVGYEKALSFLVEASDKKVVAEKYLTRMVDIISNGTSIIERPNVENAFGLFNVISEVLSHEGTSNEVMKKGTLIMHHRVMNTNWDALAVPSKPMLMAA